MRQVDAVRRRAPHFAKCDLLHRDQPAGDHAQQRADDHEQNPGGEDALERGGKRLRFLVHGPLYHAGAAGSHFV
jgi:hypothetical protein